MVTEAGKELLRNTINTAKFHNRILEENEMWKQFELERGLTMMVSDDAILNRAKSKKHHLHQCSKHRKREESANREHSVKINRVANAAGSSKGTINRWDHSGFRELYPDDSDEESSSSSGSKDSEDKWDHGGFLELYPEEAQRLASSSKSNKEHSKKWNHSRQRDDSDESDDDISNSPKNKDRKQKWDHNGFLKLYPEEAQKVASSSKSSKESSKKPKKRKRKQSKASGSDNEIWEEFKQYKRSKAAKKSKKMYDSHVREWIKHCDRGKTSSDDG